LADIQNAARNADDQRIRTEILNFFWDLVTRLLKEGHFPAARNVIANLVHMWTDIDGKAGRWDESDQDYFLLRLRESATFVTPRWTDPLSAFAGASVYLFAFVAMAKTSMDAKHYGNAREVLDTLAEARQYSPDNEYQRTFESSRRSAYLLLLAWGFLTHNGSDIDEDAAHLFSALIGRLQQESPWVVMRTAIREEQQRAIEADWWELNRKMVRGASSGFMELDSYIRAAAVSVASHQATFGIPQPSSAEDADWARPLATTLEQVSAPDGPFTVARRFFIDAAHERLMAELDAVIQLGELKRKEEIAATPLSSERIAAFHRGIETHLRTEPGLVPLLSPSLAEGDAGRADFGFNRLVPKYYFAETEVHAEPEELAETLIRGLRRGEDRIIVTAAREASRQEHTTLDELSDKVARWLAERPQVEGLIAITNSWRAAEVLAPQAMRWRRQPEPSRISIGDRDLPLASVFDSEEPYFCLCSVPHGIEISLRRLEGDLEPGAVIHQDRLLSLVREPTPHEIDLWVSEDVAPELDLRQSVVVKALEALSVSTADSHLVAFWPLPEDTY
jgi:hypothetical protein